MANKSFNHLEKYLNADGISGYEKPIAEIFKAEASKHGATVSRDGFGSVIAELGTKGPKIMIAAHMDEIGFLVQRFEKSGLVRIQPVGGHWPHVLLSNRVKVVTTSGKVFYGAIGATSVHVLLPEQRSKVMDMKDIFVDLGFESEEAARKAGVDVGDQVITISQAVLLADGDKYMAKAIDNRVGVGIIAKVIEELKGVTLSSHVYAVATAQEELGMRGARTATQHLNPDIAIAIDTTVSHDTPGIIPGDTKLGSGVAITIMDHTAMANPAFANLLFDLGKKHDIPVYKFVSQGGGNDSGVTQYSQGGIPVVTLAVPTRYLHTPSEVSSLKDFEAVVKLIVTFLKGFNNTQYQKLLYK